MFDLKVGSKHSGFSRAAVKIGNRASYLEDTGVGHLHDYLATPCFTVNQHIVAFSGLQT